MRFSPLRQATLDDASSYIPPSGQVGSCRDDSSSDSDHRDHSVGSQNPDYLSEPDNVDNWHNSNNPENPVLLDTPPRRSRSRHRHSSSRHNRISPCRERREADKLSRSSRSLSLRMTDVWPPRKPRSGWIDSHAPGRRPIRHPLPRNPDVMIHQGKKRQ